MKDHDPNHVELSKQIGAVEKLKLSSNETMLRTAHVLTLLATHYRELLHRVRSRQYNAVMFEPTAEDETPEHYVKLNAAELLNFVATDAKVNQLLDELEKVLNQD